MSAARTLLVAGGGTGGHFFPGLAVAQAWLAHDPRHAVQFVGTERGIEARYCPQRGLTLHTIDVRRLKGGGVRGWAQGLLALPQALWQGRKVLRAARPAVVLGVGGYASGPVVLAAALAGTPAAIMEQNARPGLTNRLLAPFVRRVVIAMPAARASFSARKTVLLGNPVRAEIRDRLLDAAAGRSPMVGRPAHLLVVGGSHGARGINRVVPGAVQGLLARGLDVRVRHQTGRLDSDSVGAEIKERGLLEHVEPQEFIEDMADAYAWADLVLCRAGAMTVSELAVAQRPAVLVPFPHAADNHQEANAQALVEAGAAVMVRERDLTADSLADTLAKLLGDPGGLQRRAAAAAQVARPRAAEDVVAELLRLVDGVASAGGGE